jgi:hypothetical protein
MYAKLPNCPANYMQEEWKAIEYQNALPISPGEEMLGGTPEKEDKTPQQATWPNNIPDSIMVMMMMILRR